tara:strand:- start:4733 stop:5122 length:390 start_codon:yes stop_codon:yes gene_type:complete
MEKTIQMAKSTLATIFDMEIEHFEVNVSRKANINEARRFLVYYLIKECGIRHSYMHKYIPALRSHATSIWHFRKMEELMENEFFTKESYENFKTQMEKEGHTNLMKDYVKAIKEMQMIEERLKTLKKLI